MPSKNMDNSCFSQIILLTLDIFTFFETILLFIERVKISKGSHKGKNEIISHDIHR